MKIQIIKNEDKAPQGFKRGDLLEGYKGGIYLCNGDQNFYTVDVTVIKPEVDIEYSGKFMEEIGIDNFKLFTGEITLSND
jgi:hypothetical protein